MEEKRVVTYLAYALGEIILVVVGIIIAFQLEDWRTEINNRKKEKQLLAQIHTEFLQNNTLFQYILSRQKKLQESSDWLLRNTPFDSEGLTKDSIQYHFNTVFKTYTYDPSYATVQTLLSSGSLNIIQNDTLRNLLTSWKDVLEDYSEEEIVSQDIFHNRFVPYFTDKIPFEQLVGAVPFLQNEVYKSVEFKNILFERSILVFFILAEAPTIQNHIDEILRLTNPDDDKVD